MDRQAPVTELLRQSRQGESAARERVFAIVYDDLKRVAANMLRRGFKRSALMQTTILVNCAVERLLERGALDAANQRHLFMLLARAMHDVLVEEARHNGARKRGGDRMAMPLTDAVSPVAPEQPASAEDYEELRRLLDELAKADPDSAETIWLRFHCGRSHEETAELMETTVHKVRENWDYGRAWIADRWGRSTPAGG